MCVPCDGPFEAVYAPARTGPPATKDRLAMNPHITYSHRSGTDPDRPVSVALEALSNEWRRRTLSLLSGQETMSVDELVETLAAEADHRKPTETLHLELHHCHLPKLADIGLIRYDAERGRVRARTDIGDLDSLFAAVHASGRVA